MPLYWIVGQCPSGLGPLLLQRNLLLRGSLALEFLLPLASLHAMLVRRGGTVEGGADAGAWHYYMP